MSLSAMHRLVFFILSAAAIVLPGCRDKPDANPPQVTLGSRTWIVDVAATEEQRYIGLSGRPQLAEGTGMLFLYPSERVLEFCMRDCLIPLDIAFLSADLRVVRMHTMEVEPDMAGQIVYASDSPAQYALEVGAGELAAAGVRVGDRAVFSPSVPSATKVDP